GMENANGASGDIVLEDLTAVYGNGVNYVAGYYSYNNTEFETYVKLILSDGTEIIADGISVFALDSVRAVAFSKADVEVFAEAKGYTNYEVRLSFVPLYGVGNDYAVTFVETDFTGSITGSVSFTGYIGREVGTTYSIQPVENGTWTFASDIYRDTHAYLYDAEGNEIAYDDDNGEGNNFQIVIDLEAGNSYSITIKWWNYDHVGYAPLVFAFVPATAE
ncbi:MAG: hypothetical protein IJB13_05825, partial [Clostridia bacterium]|nr:hypothetical protein [Clostridia bacterium]